MHAMLVPMEAGPSVSQKRAGLLPKPSAPINMHMCVGGFVFCLFVFCFV